MNKLRSDVKYRYIRESDPSIRTVSITVDNRTFEGVGKYEKSVYFLL